MEIRQIFKDDPLLIEYMQECKERNFLNNTTLKDLKFDYFEQSAFFCLLVDGKIREFSGVHNFDIDGKRYYRIAFRSGSLRDKNYSPKTGKSMLTCSVVVGILSVVQIQYIENLYGPQDFVITTNIDKTGAGRSHIVNRWYLEGKEPAIKKLLYEDVEYLYTRQNVWLVNKENVLKDYETRFRNFTC